MKTLGYVGWGGWVGWLGLAWFGLALSLTLLHILWKQAEGDGEIFYTVFMDLEQMRLWMAKLEQCVMNFQMDAFACVPHDCGPHGGRGDGRPGQVPGTALCLLVRVSGHTLPGGRHMRDLYDFVSTLRGSTCGRQCAALEQCRRGQLQGSNWALPGPSWWRSMSRSWQK